MPAVATPRTLIISKEASYLDGLTPGGFGLVAVVV